MTDKITILISILTFFTLSLGLTGIYLLLRSAYRPNLLLQQRNPVKDIKKFGLSNYNKSGDVNICDNDLQNDSNSYKNGFTNLLVNVYEKRTKYVLSILFISMLAMFYTLFKNIFLSFFISIMCTGITGEFIGSILRKRKETLDIQLIEFISNMIIMLRAGKEIRQIFKESLAYVKSPLKTHLKNLVNEIELNISMDTALDNFALNTGSKEAGLFANAIKINRKIGGNILIILENIIKNLQQNLRIRSQIKTQTAQNQFSSNIIALFPVAGFIGMYFFLNSAVKDFLSSTIGNILLIIGAVFEFSGFFIIKKILREDLF
ncbi:type II secretion system F family protein [bacterium]|nr:type II secretion system F family protein [bacterium]